MKLKNSVVLVAMFVNKSIEVCLGTLVRGALSMQHKQNKRLATCTEKKG
ncbi:hypothetical protein HMPREF9069_00910 [Atopobium sp. oral taxon 810 str. F0209]|nr:hypothetical protein HMPREF9069_00910 [Atopobium sp. oral taxon 810 str. F0209]